MRKVTHKALALFAITLVLFVAIVSKLPTSSCHCHDSQTSQQQKASCPFGQLRGLNSASGPLPTVQVEIGRLIEYSAIQFFVEIEGLHAFHQLRAFDSQAPPASVL